MTDHGWAPLWRARYGSEADAPESAPISATVELQLRHRSVRRYLDEPVDDSAIRAVVAAAQSASVSSNLQLLSIVAVRDTAVRERIAEALGGNAIIAAAPVVLVFVADLARAAEITAAQGESIETIGYLENTLVPFVDAGIAGQNALLAAESLGLGGVFLGALRSAPLAVAEILELPEFTFPVFGIALGHPDPAEQSDVRPRLPQSAVLHWDRYDPTAWQAAADAHEVAARAYFARFGRPDYSWRATLARRLRHVSGLNGRHRVREHLAAQGFESR